MGNAIPDSAKSGDPSARLVLHGSPPNGDTASSGSPFVAKVELFLRINGLDYDADVDWRGPKGKIPWITHGNVVLGDSTFIIDYLKNTYRSTTKIKEPETPMQKAINTACLHMCEDNLMYGIIYYQFAHPEGFLVTKQRLEARTPVPFRWILPALAQLQGQSILHKQGLGRHSDKDVSFILSSSLSALSTYLGNGKYFFGDAPCETDCIAFAFLDQYLHDEACAAGGTLVKQFPNLKDFVDRLRARYFPEARPSKLKTAGARKARGGWTVLLLVGSGVSCLAAAAIVCSRR
ncbi:unnamed protein product [Ostreobium quekettii]|uniref:Uncharacterized protein n=1 Tax=Ostreobium quekettii TaxID=121088 RepID=A0A8S1IXL9_9CHLO|nr:unnamed protein product [Ostreobium quekettii]|eukprot:evm.model.scf_562.2 EVM.evm.TU.scf_562.2   scf_562:32466-39014(-)